ncbi:hypothetical protein AXA44_37850 [Rhodococcus sp. SC4]|nr:hypothetical protein AXA44_37850 [Rhodococcus sp. SC4]
MDTPLTLNSNPVTAEVAGVPVWVIVIVLASAGTAIAVALKGRPVTAHPARTADEEIAVIAEIHDVDRTLTTHASSVLTLLAIAAGAFVTIVRTGDGPAAPLSFATVVALMTAGALATAAFALEGAVTEAGALPADDLRRTVDRNLRRIHHRTQLVRSSTWCLFPTVILVLLGAAAVAP